MVAPPPVRRQAESASAWKVPLRLRLAYRRRLTGWLAPLIFAIALSHAMLYAILVPPWLAPDEPTHYEFVRILADDLPQEPSPAIRERVLASMWTFEWWPHSRLPELPKAPRSFSEEPFLAGGVQQVGGKPTLFYQLGALVIGRSDGDFDVLTDLTRLRLLSSCLFGLAALGLFVGARMVLGRSDWAAAAALSFALLPMPAFIGSSINNDVLAMTIGAWALVPVGLARRRKLGWAALVFLVLLALAALTKATALLAVGALALVTGVSVTWRWVPSRFRPASLGVVAVLGALAFGLLIDGFEVSGWLTGPRQPIGHYSAQARSGERALALHPADSNDSDSANAVQSVPIRDLLRLRLATVRATGFASGTPGASAILRVEDGIRSSQTSVEFNTDTSWQPLQVEHTVTAGAPYLRVRLVAVGSDPDAEVRFDDVSLIVPAAADSGLSEPVLANGGFEQLAPVLRNVPLVYRLTGWELSGDNITYLIDPASWTTSRIGDLLYLLERLHVSFWGAYGWLTVEIPGAWVTAVAIVELLALAGVLVLPFRKVEWASELGRIGTAMLIVTVLLICLTLVRAFPPDPFGPIGIAQGRYLFPGLPAMTVGLLTGIAGIMPRRLAPWAPVAMVLLTFAFSASSILLIVLPWLYV